MFFTEEPCLEGEKPTMFEGERPESELEIFDDQAELIEVQRLTRMGTIAHLMRDLLPRNLEQQLLIFRLA